jgi:hypothetical protein
MVIVALVAALTTADTPAPDFPAPIGPAASGKAHCYSPDIVRKTCASMAIYSRNAAGDLFGATTVVLGKAPIVTMSTTSAMTVEGGRLCSTLRKADLDAAKFAVDGVAPDDARDVQLHNAVSDQFSPIVDHRVCVSYEPDGSGFTAHTSFDGLPRPSLDQRVIWVAPADGWKVMP